MRKPLWLQRLMDRIAAYFGYYPKPYFLRGDYEVEYLRIAKIIDRNIFNHNRLQPMITEGEVRRIRYDMAMELTRKLIPDIIWEESEDYATMQQRLTATLLRVKIK